MKYFQKSKDTPLNQSTEMYSMVARKGPSGFFALIKALNESCRGNQDLATKLQQDYSNLLLQNAD